MNMYGVAWHGGVLQLLPVTLPEEAGRVLRG
jgi:hypothetical protein